MSTLTRIIGLLPDYFDKDPANLTGLTVRYDGVTGAATVENRTLVFRVTGGVGNNLTVSLANKIIDEVVNEIAAAPGYTVLLGPASSGLPADTLYLSDGDLVAGVTVWSFTSLVWRVLYPIAWAIDQSRANVEAGADQMVIPTAGGAWLDLWGDLYGGIARKLAESDGTYAARILREIKRIRLTARALEQIVLEELNAIVQIRNLYQDSWIVAETNFGILADRRHSRTTFEVKVDRTAVNLVAQFDEQLRFLIDKHRAAGTLPFYLSENRGGNAGEVGATVVSIGSNAVRSEVALATPLTWIVAEGMLGAEALSQPNNVGSFIRIVTRPPDGSGTTLTLDVGQLDVTELG